MVITVAAFGGGTDSTAMLIGKHLRKEPVDLILFADTGGERPETYQHIETFSKWLAGKGLPEIVIVKYKRETLEENCLRVKSLPSIAYGFKKCSMKFKVQPQDQYCNNWRPAKDVWKSGGKVIKLIGYDATEERRAKVFENDKYVFQYPLIEWGWDRRKCVEVIENEGIKLPGKSACFFCPSSKATEIKKLAKNHPDLFRRALAIEDNAELTTIKGLGRDYSWREMMEFDSNQLKLFDDDYSTAEVPCGCYDGD